MEGTQGFVDQQFVYHTYRGRLLFFKKNKGDLEASLYKGILVVSVILRVMPRLAAVVLGIERSKRGEQVRGLLRALELVSL